MKQKLLFLLIALLPSAMGWADDGKMTVWLSGNRMVQVLFSETPEITYADGNVTLKVPSTELTWPIEDVQKLTFNDDDATGIKEVPTAGLDILSDSYDAYDFGGKLVKQQVKSLSELPAGKYILKNGSVTIKVVRK